MKSRVVVWKWLFLALLFLNLLVIGVVLSSLLSLRETEPPDLEQERMDPPHFLISTTKEDVNLFLRQKIEESGGRYHIYLDQFVQLEASLPVLGREVPLVMSFDPLLADEGNLILKPDSLRMGQINLPVKFLLALLGNHLELPEWVRIDPEGEEIYLAITSISGPEQNYRLAILQFDLEQDDLQILISVE